MTAYVDHKHLMFYLGITVNLTFELCAALHDSGGFGVFSFFIFLFTIYKTLKRDNFPHFFVLFYFFDAASNCLMTQNDPGWSSHATAGFTHVIFIHLFIYFFYKSPKFI